MISISDFIMIVSFKFFIFVSHLNNIRSHYAKDRHSHFSFSIHKEESYLKIFHWICWRATLSCLTIKLFFSRSLLQCSIFDMISWSFQCFRKRASSRLKQPCLIHCNPVQCAVECNFIPISFTKCTMYVSFSLMHCISEKKYYSIGCHLNRSSCVATWKNVQSTRTSRD